MSKLKEGLIKLLKEEIKFLEETSATDEELKYYSYTVHSDLKDFRRL